MGCVSRKYKACEADGAAMVYGSGAVTNEKGEVDIKVQVRVAGWEEGLWIRGEGRG